MSSWAAEDFLTEVSSGSEAIGEVPVAIAACGDRIDWLEAEGLIVKPGRLRGVVDKIEAFGALLGCLSLAACTSTQVVGDRPELEEVQSFRIGSIETGYGMDLAADRIARTHEHRVASEVARLLEEWLTETERWGGADTVRIEVERFRLPASGTRWATAQAKGNDYLGAEVSVLREGQPLARFQVEHTIGAGDRSIAENYSADRALENLLEAVAWSVAHELTPFEERRGIFEVGKREQIERAIEMLELCGELSYAEAAKYGALGKISLKTGSGAEARRLKKAFGGKLKRCY
jgi:hypothetical protein